MSEGRGSVVGFLGRAEPGHTAGIHFESLGELTVPVVTQVDQLVAPLGKNAQRVLDKRDHDQEPADRGKVPVGENTVSEDSRSLVWGWCCVCFGRGRGHTIPVPSGEWV